MKSQVSVIIPVYNVEKYLAECLDSIVNQTLENVEIICVDDGSTDSSGRILQSYKEKDSRIKIITKENGGLSSARNAGVLAATGKYILFLDSDDLLKENALEILEKKAEELQTDVLYFGAECFSDDSNVKVKEHMDSDKYKRKNIPDNPLSGPEMLEYMVLRDEYITSACLVLIEREFYIDADLNFYDGILHEDNLFSFRLILAEKRGFIISDSLYLRRVRMSSIMTQTKNHRHCFGYYVSFTEANAILANAELTEKQRMAAEKVVGDMFLYASMVYGQLSDEERQKLRENINPLELFYYKTVIEPALGAADAEYKYNAINTSTSYKVGKAITKLPRMIKAGLKK